MDTDSLYLVSSEENLKDVILPEKQDKLIAVCSRQCEDAFTANAIYGLILRMCLNTNKKHDMRKPKLFMEEFR